MKEKKRSEGLDPEDIPEIAAVLLKQQEVER